MELHLRYRKLVAEYYAGDKRPFMTFAYANDGHLYQADDVEASRCRCAKWNCDSYYYTENDIAYRRETWTGPGEGIAFVTSEDRQIR